MHRAAPPPNFTLRIRDLVCCCTFVLRRPMCILRFTACLDALLAALRRRQGRPGCGHQERARDVERIESTGQKASQEGVIMAAKSKRRKIKVAPYDSADYLKTEEDIKNYLEAVFEEPMDRQMLIHTLGVVARARGMMKLAKETGITRAGLYKALSPKGNPSFETVAK